MIKDSKNFFKILILIIGSFGIFADDLPEFKVGEEDAKAYFKNGLYYLHSHQYGASKESFIQALSLKSNFKEARKYLSNAYYLSGDWQESLNELELIEKNDIDPIIKNRAEIIRILISGSSKKHDLTFYKYISGDEHRGYRFKNPTDAIVDESGNIYILSFTSANIIKLDPNGFPLANIRGGYGRTFEGPSFFTLHKNNLYVTDYLTDMVYTVSDKGNIVSRIGGKGIEKGMFHGPSGIEVSKNDKIYVVDSSNNRVQKFNLSMEYIQEFGNKNSEAKLLTPKGITLDENGTVLVVDTGNKRIVNFDDEGNFIKEITHPNMRKPRSIKIHNGKYYIADEENGLMIYNPLKEKWTKLNTYRDESGDFTKLLRPVSTAMDYVGSLYAVDYARHRIAVFSPKNYLTSNINVFIEKVDTSNFPNVSLFLYVRNRNNQDLTSIQRTSFRVIEEGNVYPLVGMSNMKKFNEQIYVSMIYENSKKIIELSKDTENIQGVLGSFLQSLTKLDKVELIRAGKDTELVYPFGRSELDIYSKIRNSKPEKEYINLGKAIYQGISDILEEIGPRALVVLVTGEKIDSAFNQYNPLRIIQYANAHSIPIHFLSLTDDGSMIEVYKDIASRTGGIFIKVPGSLEEKELYNKIISKKDNRYIISYKSKLPSELVNKYINLELDVNYRDIIGKSMSGFFLPDK